MGKLTAAQQIQQDAIDQAVADFLEADAQLDDLVTYARTRRAVKAQRCFALGLSRRDLARRAGKSQVVTSRLALVQLPPELAAAVATGARVDF